MCVFSFFLLGEQAPFLGVFRECHRHKELTPCKATVASPQRNGDATVWSNAHFLEKVTGFAPPPKKMKAEVLRYFGFALMIICAGTVAVNFPRPCGGIRCHALETGEFFLVHKILKKKLYNFTLVSLWFWYKLINYLTSRYFARLWAA